MSGYTPPSSRLSIAHVPRGEGLMMKMNDENTGANMTTALDFDLVKNKAAARDKKMRSKSLGPGGLGALREDTGNRIKLPPKSILKAVLPLSPLRRMPLRRSASPSAKGRVSGRTKSVIQVARSPDPGLERSPEGEGQENAAPQRLFEGLFSDLGNAARKKTESGQPTARSQTDEPTESSQTDEERKRQLRDVRRMSLAARRVSFAPEATVHHFAEIEDMQDSTTSSASTNSSRHASGISDLSSRGNTMHKDVEANNDDPGSTPPAQIKHQPETTSSEHQRNLRQKKHRRTSVDEIIVEDADDVFSSSPSNESPRRTEVKPDDLVKEQNVGDAGDECIEEDDEDDEDGPANMFHKLDAGHTGRWQRVEIDAGDDPSKLSPGSLTQTAKLPGSFDETGEIPMEMAGDEITAAFRPWVQKLFPHEIVPSLLPSTTEQEDVNPFSPAFKSSVNSTAIVKGSATLIEDDEMSMDVTRAVGGILFSDVEKHGLRPRKNKAIRRKSLARRRSSFENCPVDNGETMDFTTAIGGIQHVQNARKDVLEVDENEELSMEFTSVLGGIKGYTSQEKSQIKLAQHSPSQPPTVIEHDVAMEMTRVWGGPMATHESAFNSRDTFDDLEMDMTLPMGTIISENNVPFHSVLADSHEETVEIVAFTSPLRSVSTTRSRPHLITSSTGSPVSKLFVGETTGDSDVLSGTPQKLPSTPSKQFTPRPVRSATPSKSTPLRNVSMRMPSPKKLFWEQIKKADTPRKVATQNLFRKSQSDGLSTPHVVLQPTPKPQKRLSGIGADKAGLGSPRIAHLLDRRASLVAQADLFSLPDLSTRNLRYADPRVIDMEVTRTREEDTRRESGQFILELEAGAELQDKAATTSLKELITSMTPKKENMKPRKSLALGEARGLLGKRPAELNEDEEHTPPGLRGRQSSPVKRVKLCGPPSKLETTGRSAPRSLIESIAVAPHVTRSTPSTTSTARPQTASTPHAQGRFKDVEAAPSPHLALFFPRHPVMEVRESEQVADEEVEEKIQLQEFLNMTNIRFMELTTTKRRNTVAPNSQSAASNSVGSNTDSAKLFEDCVVAGACTVPLLELYQHSCRELKKYIHDGREIVREIEVDTFEDNPPLFREYMSATPRERAVMDDQFRNMKIHARLLSKGMWYEWRKKLLEGLEEGLLGHAKGMQHDHAILTEREEVIQPILSAALDDNARLNQEYLTLKDRADQFPESDEVELQSARTKVMSLDERIISTKLAIEGARNRLGYQKTAVSTVAEASAECQEAIKEAQRVREACRGWTVAEVVEVKAKLDALESEHGWAVTGTSGTTLTMTYRRQLELFFDASAFLPAASSSKNTKSATISLTRIADARNHDVVAFSTETRFFLQLMRAHLQCLDQPRTEICDVLSFISQGWTRALSIAAEVASLTRLCVTHCNILGDERLEVRAMMLLSSVKTKVYVRFEIAASAAKKGVDVKIRPTAKVVYGETFREDRMSEFLVKGAIKEGRSWAGVVAELNTRLTARGRKG